MTHNSPGYDRFAQGANLFARGEYVESIIHFTRAIELDPQFQTAFMSRGVAWAKAGNMDKAEEDFDRAIELNPRYGVAYFSRGTTLSELGDMERAGNDMVMAARIGEAHLQGFADDHNIWRTKYDKVMAELSGEREPDIAVTPNLRSWLDG